MAFILDAEIYGQLQILPPHSIATETKGFLIQLLAAFVGTMAFSVLFSVPRKFPLVPGAGIFWTSYNIVSDNLNDALQTGFIAVKITVAIAFGILLITELNSKNRLGKLLHNIFKL